MTISDSQKMRFWRKNRAIFGTFYRPVALPRGNISSKINMEAECHPPRYTPP
jgi:hypothetical protein